MTPERFLSIYLFVILIYRLLSNYEGANPNVYYYGFRDHIPLALFFLFQVFPTNRSFNLNYRAITYALLAILVIPFWNLVVLKPIVTLSYMVFGIVIAELFYKRLQNFVEALIYGVLTLLSAGWIYELPMLYPYLFFNKWHPLLLHSGMIATFLVLHKLGPKPFQKTSTKIAWIGLLPISLWFHFNPHMGYIKYFIRLPTLIAMTLTLLQK